MANSPVEAIKSPGPAHLPGWPRAMRLPWAAAYVGMAASTFLREVDAGRAPKPLPKRPGCAVVRWLRDDLDRGLEELAAEAEDREASNPWDRP